MLIAESYYRPGVRVGHGAWFSWGRKSMGLGTGGDGAWEETEGSTTMTHPEFCNQKNQEARHFSFRLTQKICVDENLVLLWILVLWASYPSSAWTYCGCFYLSDPHPPVQFATMTIWWYTVQFKQHFLQDSCPRVLTTEMSYVFLFLLKWCVTVITVPHIKANPKIKSSTPFQS